MPLLYQTIEAIVKLLSRQNSPNFYANGLMREKNIVSNEAEAHEVKSHMVFLKHVVTFL